MSRSVWRNAQISVLWLIFLLGMAMHMLLAMMPLFAGQSVATDEMPVEKLLAMTWMTTFIVVIPMVLASLVLILDSKAFKWVNLVFAAVYFLLNAYHWIAHLAMAGEAPFQVLLLLVILGISVILAAVSWRWLKEPAEAEALPG